MKRLAISFSLIVVLALLVGPSALAVEYHHGKGAVMENIGKGRYLRSTGIWVYNFETDGYSVPIGIGFNMQFMK